MSRAKVLSVAIGLIAAAAVRAQAQVATTAGDFSVEPPTLLSRN